MAHSSKAVTEESPTVTRRLRRASPDPGIGPQVELSGRHARSLFDLFGIGKTLSSQGIAAEEPPPALLQIEPARPGGNEDVMDAGMPFQPGARLQAVMAAEIIANHVDIAPRVICL